MADMNEAVKLLATILREQFQKHTKCGKLQFTPYGECVKCVHQEDCHRLEWILNEEPQT